MEKIILNNVQLDFLARHDPRLEPHFYGTVPCDKLPRHPQKDRSVGYIVNTDSHDRPGRHWIALWTTSENVCEIFDSYVLPLQVYETTQPLIDWINTYWKYVVRSSKSLQSLYSHSCGDYALMYLRHRARRKDISKFLKLFSRHDFVANDHKVGQMLKKLIEKAISQEEWCMTSGKDSHQTCKRIFGKELCFCLI